MNGCKQLVGLNSQIQDQLFRIEKEVLLKKEINNDFNN